MPAKKSPATSKPAKRPAKKAAAKRRPAAATKKSATSPAEASPRSRTRRLVAVVHTITTEDIALRAYYIAERRQHLGLPGDAQSDWLEAEKQLRR